MAWVVGIGIFLFLLFAFPRQVAGLIAFVVAIGAATWLYYTVSETAEARERAKVAVSVNTGAGCKDPAYPIGVLFTNGTRKRINSISFTLVSARPGYSSTLSDQYLTSDKIMDPGAAYFSCWRLDPYDRDYGRLKGVEPSSLIWTATISKVRFAE